MSVTAAGPIGSGIQREQLHSSVSDPVLDTMNFLNEVTMRFPDAISFAPGRPYDGFFEVEEIFTQLRRYLDHLAGLGRSAEEQRAAVFQYGPTAGSIREVIAESLRVDEGIRADPRSIVVTVGAQEAMVLALRALISSPDDVLLVSAPCYVGITGAARLFDVRMATVTEQADGLRCADVAAAVEAQREAGRRVRVLYVVPDHSNPLGSTMSLALRRELLDLAGRLDFYILEDSPYRLVSRGPQVPTLKSLDAARRVVHVGSFSKTLFPGARVGYAVADQPVDLGDGRSGLLADELCKIKSMLTVNTSSLSQAVVAGMLLASEGSASRRNDRTSAQYGRSMEITLRELERQFPAHRRRALGVGWNRPTGGFFLRLSVPFVAGDAALNRSAQHHGVIWTPMSYFYPDGGGDTGIRLSVSYLSEPEIVDGVARLARFVDAEMRG
ncbi:PLP-dependent aminotransferase family protein [Dactylosporangium sp. CA-092794]|uniref:aminotransferase-like domain-containing protein n=1 Tax=Dactylosporangium sp. CA-092794 TaxID=3239929 RepID=UPI003D93A73B